MSETDTGTGGRLEQWKRDCLDWERLRLFCCSRPLGGSKIFLPCVQVLQSKEVAMREAAAAEDGAQPFHHPGIDVLADPEEGCVNY